MFFRAITICFGFAAMAVLAPAAMAMSTTWDFADQLTLNPHATEVSSDNAADTDGVELADDDLNLDTDQKTPAAKSSAEISGFDFADFNNNVKAIAYRTDQGVGLGLATTGGVALTGGFTTRDGMQVSVYYVRRWSPIAETARGIGLDFADQPDKTIGITVGWKF